MHDAPNAGRDIMNYVQRLRLVMWLLQQVEIGADPFRSANDNFGGDNQRAPRHSFFN